MPFTEASFDLDQRYHRFFPLFENYIVNFKNRVNNVTYATQNNNAHALVPTNWSDWNAETYNPNYFLTKVADKINNIS